MSKQVEFSEIQNLAADLDFKPSMRDREAKSKFWTRLVDDPFGDVEAYGTRDAAERLTGMKLSSWDKPGYKDWFFNKEEHKHRIEYLFHLALDAAEEVLLNSDPKAQGARVQLIKALSELAGKMPPRNGGAVQVQNNALSGAIAGMDKAQLELYVQKHDGNSLRLSASKGDTSSTITIDTEE